MQEINQNFPSVVASLSRMKVFNSLLPFQLVIAWEIYVLDKCCYPQFLDENKLSDILFYHTNVMRFQCIQVNDSIKDEILANQRMVPPGKSLMALNGALINIEDIDLYR